MEHRLSRSRLRGLFSRMSARDEAKGNMHDKTERGANYLAPPPKPDKPTAKVVQKPTPPHSRPRGLWDDAFDAASNSPSTSDLKGFANIIREDIQQKSSARVDAGSPDYQISPELQICRDVLQVAQDQETKFKDKKWYFSLSHNVNIGEVYGEVATWVQKFVGVGDIVAQIDPVHVGLPWAAIRLILTASPMARMLLQI